MVPNCLQVSDWLINSCLPIRVYYTHFRFLFKTKSNVGGTKSPFLVLHLAPFNFCIIQKHCPMFARDEQNSK